MQAEQPIGIMLDRHANSIAGFAAEALLRQLADAGQTDGAGFRYWHAFFEARIDDLSAAVAAGQPRLFISQVRWCRAGLAARSIDADQIRLAIAALRDVIVSQANTGSNDVVASYLDPALADCDRLVNLPDTLLDVSTSEGRLAAGFILSVLEGRRLDACRTIHEAVDHGLPVTDAYLNVLVPAVREIGRMWHMDEVSVAEEHFASDTAQILLAQLQGRAHIAPANGRTLVAASVAGNRHDMGTQIVGNLFEMQGWRVICLGGDMPGADIARAVIDFNADLLLLSATLHTHLRAVERTIELVRGLPADQQPRILVGGLAFDQAPELAGRYRADAHAGSAEEALSLARRWFDQ